MVAHVRYWLGELWADKARLRRVAMIGGMDQFNILTSGACQQIRAVSVPLYASASEAQAGYILREAEAELWRNSPAEQQAAA